MGDRQDGQRGSVDERVAAIERLSARLADAERALAERDERIQQLTSQVAALHSLHGGTALALAGAARRSVIRLLPPQTRRAKAVGYVLERVPVSRGGPTASTGAPAPKSEANRYVAAPEVVLAEYRRWRQEYESGPAELRSLGRANAGWDERPLITVLLAVDGGGARLDESVDSVVAQIYDHWELWIVADPSQPEPAPVVEGSVATDPRIHFLGDRPSGGAPGLARATAESRGEWVVCLNAGDRLRPDALHRIVAHIGDHPDHDVVYGDDDHLSVHGTRERPEMKPDWSPEYLLSRDYLGPSTTVRRTLLEGVGGWNEEYGTRTAHDLHLRVGERARAVGHVPAVLVSRDDGGHPRRATAPAGNGNPVEDALRRRGRAGRAIPRIDGRAEVTYDVRYELEGLPSVDIIIPTRDRVELLSTCIDSITKRSTYPSYRIVVVDNDSVEEATQSFLERGDLTVVPGPGPFNFSALVNAGVRASRADYVLLLNNDVTVLTDDWIEALLELAQHPDVGAVGCRLVFPDRSAQHEGIALLPDYVAANVTWPWPVIRDTAAVTAACMLVRRDLYWSIDGFDEEMGIVYNDVDFCLRMRRSGRQVLYTPFAELEHNESASRGRANPQADIDLFFSRWGTPDQLEDPFISPHVVWPHPQRLRLGVGSDQ